jgi:hypothetical protein
MLGAACPRLRLTTSFRCVAGQQIALEGGAVLAHVVQDRCPMNQKLRIETFGEVYAHLTHPV